MSGGETLAMGAFLPVVECPYCGALNTLHEAVGTWVKTCDAPEQRGGGLGVLSYQRGGCGKEFVVRATRRVLYSAKAAKIEGQS